MARQLGQFRALQFPVPAAMFALLCIKSRVSPFVSLIVPSASVVSVGELSWPEGRSLPGGSFCAVRVA